MRAFFMSSILLSIAIFSGCNWPEKRFPEMPGCTSQIVPVGNNFSITGVKIPVNPNFSVNIAGVTYSPKQLQKLTESVMKIDQYKMGQCGILDVARRSSPPPSLAQLQPLLLQIAKLNQQTLQIGMNIQSGAVDAATLTGEAEAEAKNLPPDPTPVPLSDSGTSAPPTNVEQPSNDFISRLTGIENFIKSLRVNQNSIDERKLIVRGFAPNSVALTAQSRVDLLAEINKLSAVNLSKPAVFDVVGFADRSGSYSRNATLGLERARVVAEILSLHVSPFPIIRVTSSAGAAGIGSDSRRVEVYYTGYRAQQSQGG